VRAEEQAAAAQAVTHERRRYEEAASKLRSLRHELIRMAQDADKRVTDEAAARHAAEASNAKHVAAVATLKSKLAASEEKAAELAAALRLTTTALQAAEARGYTVALASETSERELTDLRGIVDRTLSVVARGTSRKGQTAAGPTASVAVAGPDAALDDSLRSAAELNDLTQRLSAYVRSGSTRRKRSSSITSSVASTSTIARSSTPRLLIVAGDSTATHADHVTARATSPAGHGVAAAADRRTPLPTRSRAGDAVAGPAEGAGPLPPVQAGAHTEVDLDAVGERLTLLARSITATLGAR